MRLSMVVAFALLLSSFPASAQFDQILKGINKPKGSDNGQVASGLKQALEVGTKNTVSKVGVTDGYFANAAIKILMPDKLRPLEKGLRMMGKGPEIDSFVLAMNRAAEKAAPGARRIFLDAITGMSFEDARGILSGGDTAATAYFKEKTADKLRAAFQPVVESSMSQVGVVQQYEGLTKKFESVPFAKKETFDINGYVVGKSLDGLFYVLGEEEKKIRTNPAAQVTPLLKEVFGKHSL
jgi:Protein of unknown function (DUF4197)